MITSWVAAPVVPVAVKVSGGEPHQARRTSLRQRVGPRHHAQGPAPHRRDAVHVGRRVPAGEAPAASGHREGHALRPAAGLPALRR